MKVVAALIPSIGMLLVGAVILRAVIYGDRRERQAQHAWEQEQDAAMGATAAGPASQQPLDRPGSSPRP